MIRFYDVGHLGNIFGTENCYLIVVKLFHIDDMEAYMAKVLLYNCTAMKQTFAAI